MKTVLHQAETRGHANHGWLNSYHTFSFAGYMNPERNHFGLLRVLNDDTVQASMGFGTHPHDNMEIVSIPLAGALEHKDSTGRHKIIRTNEVQIMSAGTGIYHSEYNASDKEDVKFLQIWVYPKLRNIPPRYDQKEFAHTDRVNKIQTVVAPDENANTLFINQDAWFSLSDVEAGAEVTYQLHQPGNGVYVFAIDGKANVAGQEMNRRDGLAVTETDSITAKGIEASQLLFIEVPLQ